MQKEEESMMGLVEVPNDQNQIRVFVQFDEPCPVLVVHSESVKSFVHAF
jgi:hypothetical protein